MSGKVGILTGGGDCPGLNAVIYSLVRSGLNDGYEFIGFKKGYEGLIAEVDGYIKLDLDTIRGISHLGGTILKTTNKGNFSAKVGENQSNALPEELMKRVKANLDRLGVTCLVIIGGDGSLSTALQFQQHGINVVGVPKTIDNDLNSTDRTFGFSTSIEIVREGISKIHTTATSHDRVFFVEIMGRNVGWLTLLGGLAGGAHMILIPEIPFRYEAILEFLRTRRAEGRDYVVVAVAEGAKAIGGDQIIQRQREKGENLLGGIAANLADIINDMSPDEFDIRTVVFGHLQRGGPPNAEDIILAKRFGFAAMDNIKNGRFGEMVSLKGDAIVSIPLQDAVENLKQVDPNSEFVNMAKSLGVSFGE